MTAGATETGKSVSLMVLAEGFSRLGVSVFVADIKGDMAGLVMPGTLTERISFRLKDDGLTDYANQANPAIFWAIFCEQGHPS